MIKNTKLKVCMRCFLTWDEQGRMLWIVEHPPERQKDGYWLASSKGGKVKLTCGDDLGVEVAALFDILLPKQSPTDCVELEMPRRLRVLE